MAHRQGGRLVDTGVIVSAFLSSSFAMGEWDTLHIVHKLDFLMLLRNHVHCHSGAAKFCKAMQQWGLVGITFLPDTVVHLWSFLIQ